jgi:peptide/nickel transport system substrate-binding protein
VTEVRAADDYTVEVVTDGPNPLLPNNLTNIMMLDSGWAAENGAEAVQDYAAGEDTYAARNTNGTGPYVLTSREADVRTVLTPEPRLLGHRHLPAGGLRDHLHPDPEPRHPRRGAADGRGRLHPGRAGAGPRSASTEADGIGLATAPQNRVIFFGMNVGDDDLTLDSVEGANPFADLRVRQAMEHRHQPRSDPAGRDARPVAARGRHRAAADQRLDGRTGRIPRL